MFVLAFKKVLSHLYLVQIQGEILRTPTNPPKVYRDAPGFEHNVKAGKFSYVITNQIECNILMPFWPLNPLTFFSYYYLLI